MKKCLDFNFILLVNKCSDFISGTLTPSDWRHINMATWYWFYSSRGTLLPTSSKWLKTNYSQNYNKHKKTILFTVALGMRQCLNLTLKLLRPLWNLIYYCRKSKFERLNLIGFPSHPSRIFCWTLILFLTWIIETWTFHY